MIYNKFLIIPDVHGRTFWENAVKQFADEFITLTKSSNKLPNYHIVFLGDYIDPYIKYDNISETDAYENFLSILEWRKIILEKYKEYIDTGKLNVIMMIGNHDFHYVVPTDSCRIDYKRHDNYTRIFKGAIDYSNESVSEEKFVFWKYFTKEYLHTSYDILMSHAGFTSSWLNELYADMYSLNRYGKIDPEIINNDNVQYKLNFISNAAANDIEARKKLNSLLGHISHHRGGWHYSGSCIWADINETFDDYYNKLISNDLWQFFGHTYAKEEIIEDKLCLAMLDCGGHAYVVECNDKLDKPTIIKI